MKRKIAVLTGARAEYGLLRPVMKKISNSPKLELITLVTGSHLIHKFGYSLSEIEEDGFKIDYKISMYPEEFKSSDKNHIPKYLGRGIIGVTTALEKSKPNILVVLGDRGEALIGAIAAAYLNIPIAHIQGGDHCVGGDIDDSIRHAITKLSHIHFPATSKSAGKILQMGEEKWRIFISGATALDSILREKLPAKEKIEEALNLELNQPTILVLQHAVSSETKYAGEQMRETMEAIKELKKQTIVLYPNADPGSSSIISVIEEYKGYPFIHIYKTLPHDIYLGLMKTVAVMVGNSSSGIIEAPSFKLSVVNIGIRQIGREKANNTIDVDYKKDEIIEGIKKALYDEKFSGQVKECVSPYGDGRAASRMVKVLSSIEINKKLLQKKFIARKIL